MQADGRVNLLVELLAGFNVVRGEPAAHAFILQAFVQTVGKLLVLARIADEAGVELNRAADNRKPMQAMNSSRRPAPRRKNSAILRLERIDRIYADRAGSTMAHGIQSFRRAQIDVGLHGPAQSGFAEVRLPEVRPAQVRQCGAAPAEVRTLRLASTRSASAAQVRLAERRPAEIRHAEVRLDQSAS